MNSINMNHAATSPHKSEEVIRSVMDYLQGNNQQSIGRGGDELASASLIMDARMAVAGLFHAKHPAQVVFTSGATESLNMAIHGLVQQGCHVLATSMEHNAVARPLHLLQQQGLIDVTWLPCADDGAFNPQSISTAIQPHTRMLIMTHASNVVGNVLPIEESFALAKEHGLWTILDAAQSAGHIEVTLGKHTDIIAFTGHKALRGLAGTGGLVLSKAAREELNVWKAGGTGSHSHMLDMPAFSPDRFEPGTPNIMGIIALQAAVEALEKQGLDAIAAHERRLTSRFIDGAHTLPLSLYGSYDKHNWVPVVSLNHKGIDAGVLARRLQDEYSIFTRSGLHCAPLAHRSLGTYPEGTLRFSFGIDTTFQEIDATLEALDKICTSV